VTRSRLEWLLRLTARTEDEELSCSECLDLLPKYVDLEVAGQAANVALPAFHQHLEHLEAEGRSPSIDDLRRTL
jgi:hypothetical protein